MRLFFYLSLNMSKQYDLLIFDKSNINVRIVMADIQRMLCAFLLCGNFAIKI